MNPPLKWVGGKRKALSQIKALLPKSYNNYHEPFVGGGALFFDLAPPRQAFICDVNRHLITTYCALRDNCNKVIQHLKQFTYKREVYDAVRAFNFERGDIYLQAADFIYCNKVGFNGLYRVNASGRYNVPFGRHSNPQWCNEENLKAASLALMNSNILPIPFWESAKLVEKDDLVYMDPPYIPLDATSNFTFYSKDGFTIADHMRLRDVAVNLRKRGAHVILSNSSSPVVYELYEKTSFKIKEINSLRCINSNPDKRGPVKEVLIY